MANKEQNKTFNRDDINDIYDFFFTCPKPDKESLDWLKETARNEEDASKALMAIMGINHSLEGTFSPDSLLAVIECIDAPVELVAHCAMGTVMDNMIWHDSQVRCHPELQEAFMKAKEKHGEKIWEEFIHHCHAVHDRYFGINVPEQEDIDPDNLPEEFYQLMEETGMTKEELLEEMPRDEEGYARMHNVLNHLQGSWIAEVFIPYEEDKEDSDEKVLPDSPEGMLFYMGLYIGRGEFLWADMEQAERWLKRQIEEEHTKNPLDYLHAGHLALYKGDKEKAMDYYHQAYDLSTNKPFLKDMFLFEKKYLVTNYDFDENDLNQAETQLK